MKINRLALLTAVVLSGCDTKKNTTDESTSASDSDSTSFISIKADTERTQCYALAMNGDTIQLSLTRQGADVMGTLHYRLAGKDQNTGILRGRMWGDTLKAEYIFQSEGVESVQEVVFLAKGDGFMEGYGPIEERDGKAVFIPDSTLTFDADQILAKIPCR